MAIFSSGIFFNLLFVASFSYSRGELDDNFERQGDKERPFFLLLIVNPCDTISPIVNISLDEVSCCLPL